MSPTVAYDGLPSLLLGVGFIDTALFCLFVPCFRCVWLSRAAAPAQPDPQLVAKVDDLTQVGLVLMMLFVSLVLIGSPFFASTATVRAVIAVINL